MIIISQSVKFKTVTLNFKSKESVRGTYKTYQPDGCRIKKNVTIRIESQKSCQFPIPLNIRVSRLEGKTSMFAAKDLDYLIIDFSRRNY